LLAQSPDPASVTQLASLRFAINNSPRDTPRLPARMLAQTQILCCRRVPGSLAPDTSPVGVSASPFGVCCANPCRRDRAPPPRDESFAFIDGGGERVRTDDLRLAKPALSQLSYTPFRDRKTGIGDRF
jgi:hypothetical protein